MKNLLDFKTLMEFTDYFCDEKTCVEHFTATRFRDGEYCPHCRHDKVYKCAGGKRYHCPKCKQDFTIRTKTVFGESKLPLRKWYMAVYLLSTTSKGISSVQLAKHVGVTQKTAWFMAHRIRKAHRHGNDNDKLSGRVECDETYIGGLARNMHEKAKKRKNIGTGGKGKTLILGMRQRGGQVKATVVKDNSASSLHPAIKQHVEAGSTLYTDEHRAYWGLKSYLQFNVNHSQKQFVLGIVHTNGIESFWALFKRGYHGIYHWMSAKHLQRYIDECAFRLNRRGNEMRAVFGRTVENITDASKLPYQELIA